MKHIYVASHGHFARGLVNSLSLLIGDEHGVIPVCAYDEDIVTTEQLEQTLEHLIVQANGDEVVIFTDLLGGSINNSAVSVLMRHRNVFVVAGINLTLLLEFLLELPEPLLRLLQLRQPLLPLWQQLLLQLLQRQFLLVF